MSGAVVAGPGGEQRATPSAVAVLQAVRLKGRATPEALADALGCSVNAAAQLLGPLVDEGLAEPTPRGHRLSERGRERLDQELAAERAGLDREQVAQLYEHFSGLDGELKELVTAWQLRPAGGEPVVNDHSDHVYDRSVLTRLAALHRRALPLVEQLAAAIPRLAPYPARLSAAVARVGAGEHRYIATPVVDSYHTVWFELHEELLQAAGRTRAAEAAAGRGA